MMQALWMFLPDQFLSLVIMGVGFMLILGLISGRTAFNTIALFVILPLVAAPFIEALFGALPLWISLLIMVVVGLSILRGLASLFIGSRAADTMTGTLAADVVRLLVRCLFWPFRVVGWCFRTMSNRGL